MNLFVADKTRRAIDDLYRTQSRRIFATLVRLLGDFDLAEDALHDAFSAAIEQWVRDGIPENPRAWLVSTGKFKAIDAIRRRARLDTLLPMLAEQIELNCTSDIADKNDVEDDTLRLIFTCCNPALSVEARIALTLREVCGLSTDEIARAFFAAPSTLAQRIVRAKAKIRDAGIPFKIPSAEELPERLDTVLHVIYLVFNEGYSATSGGFVTRADLCKEAIRLVRLLIELMPSSEADGLLALMLLHGSRRLTRMSATGDLVLLEEQDRSQWDREAIAEGKSLVERALQSRRFGPYTLQAAIAAVHADAESSDLTDWEQIVGLYDVLLRITPSPVIELNRAVAVAMRDGAESGLRLVSQLLESGELSGYHLAHSAHAELSRRVGKISQAISSYENALEYAQQEPERRFLKRRQSELIQFQNDTQK